jgi:hypothetical protein
LQLLLGLLMGIAFGFFLQRGGLTDYDVIIGQLLLEDFTVFKVMISAVVVGMPGVYMLRSAGLAQLHPKPGSIGTTVIGGLIFGAGFAILGYCPGTAAGAVGQGSLDALLGGVVGMVVGSWIFASAYPKLEDAILTRGDFGMPTIPELLGVSPWIVIPPVMAGLVVMLYLLELLGF